MSCDARPLATTGQPVGPQVDATPARRPGPVTLSGRYGRLERLERRHAEQLWHAGAGHEALWTYMSYGPFSDQRTFAEWLASRVPLEDPYSYAIDNQLVSSITSSPQALSVR
ncbi:MAG: hypothetical protein IT537_31320 [Hyphomicrobiales bacterium]|nr:hypothetical protein [Hyphomicrobiales bacterium]